MAGHDRTGAKGLYTGTLRCEIAPETPILMLSRDGRAPSQLPASSLRGMVRAVTEIAGQGCGGFIGNPEMKFRDSKGGGAGRPPVVSWTEGARFPHAGNEPCHKVPENQEIIEAAEKGKQPVDWTQLKLCRSCAIFGFALEQACWRGRVRFSAGRLHPGAWRQYDPANDPSQEMPLRSPMPHHLEHYFTDAVWNPYTMRQGDRIYEAGTMAGRKVYLHHNAPGQKPAPMKVRFRDATAWMAGQACRFRFDIGFRNLRMEELGLVMFATDLERPGASARLRHHYGYAKPAGWGSIRIHAECVVETGGWYDGYDTRMNVGKPNIDSVKNAFFKNRDTAAGDWAAFEEWLRFPGTERLRYPTLSELRGGW
jgi:hypothetical protein